jgi:putative hydrolase of the HAD superfamily
MTGIRAVLFDLDDTLIVDEAVSKETFARVAQVAMTQFGADAATFERSAHAHAKRLWAEGPAHAYCRRIGISAYECLWGNFVGDSEDLTTLRTWATNYRRAVFDAALRDQQLEPDDLIDCGLAKAFYDQRRKLQRLMPDAKEILTRLAPKYRIALLTNGAPDLQREKIAASSLQPFFDAIAVSGEHDIGKPKAEIFHRLLAELDTPADEAVMVGNSLERDIAGARNAGICSIWLRVPGSEEPDAVTPDHTINGLIELPSLIEKIILAKQSI